MSLCLIVFFYKQTKETLVKREMRAKITSLCLISFFFINKRKTHKNECEKSLQYIKS